MKNIVDLVKNKLINYLTERIVAISTFDEVLSFAHLIQPFEFT